MDIFKESSIRREFSKGQEIDIIVVLDGEEIDSQTFSKKTHEIEEVLDFIVYNENSGNEVYS